MESNATANGALTPLSIVGGFLRAYGASVLFEEKGWPHGRLAGAIVLCLVPMACDLGWRYKWGSGRGFERYLFPSAGLSINLLVRVPLWIGIPALVAACAIALVT